jgi:hypothetical protein
MVQIAVPGTWPQINLAPWTDDTATTARHLCGPPTKCWFFREDDFSIGASPGVTFLALPFTAAGLAGAVHRSRTHALAEPVTKPTTRRRIRRPHLAVSTTVAGNWRLRNVAVYCPSPSRRGASTRRSSAVSATGQDDRTASRSAVMLARSFNRVERVRLGSLATEFAGGHARRAGC